MNDKRPQARAVTINGIRYTVAQTIFSGSRGWEYSLTRGYDYNCRVCHAPPSKVLLARASGEEIVYHW